MKAFRTKHYVHVSCCGIKISDERKDGEWKFRKNFSLSVYPSWTSVKCRKAFSSLLWLPPLLWPVCKPLSLFCGGKVFLFAIQHFLNSLCVLNFSFWCLFNRYEFPNSWFVKDLCNVYEMWAFASLTFVLYAMLVRGGLCYEVGDFMWNPMFWGSRNLERKSFKFFNSERYSRQQQKFTETNHFY